MTSPYRIKDLHQPNAPSPQSSAPQNANQGGSNASTSADQYRLGERRGSADLEATRFRSEQTEEIKSRDRKIDQIVSHFYSKTCAVISQSRMTNVEELSSPSTFTGTLGGTLGSNTVGRRGSTGKKLNKWFNLELEETDLFRTELKTWKSISTLLAPSPTSSLTQSALSPDSNVVPPMIIDIILDTREMTANQVLVISDQNGRRSRVDLIPCQSSDNYNASGNGGIRSPKSLRSNIVLETWSLNFTPVNRSNLPELPSIYKNAIILFRNLFMFIRVLPTFHLFKKLSRRQGGIGVIGKGLSIGCGIRTTSENSFHDIEVNRALFETTGNVTETVRFGAILTPLGSLSIECTYRLNTDFSVEDIETLLSSRFIDEDFFRPTIIRNTQQPSRPESLPIRSIISPPTPQSLHNRAATIAPASNSYGSLSSRHPIPFPSINVDPRLIPLPKGVEVESPNESVGTEGSRTRYGSYHTPGVEPAFVSLARARVASMQSGVSPIQRNIPVASSSSRRQSFTSAGNSYSPSSSSPIFRTGSYLSAGQQSQPQSTHSFTPSTRLSTSPSGNVFGQGSRTSSAPHVTSLLSFGARSPLAPPVTSEPRSGLSFGAPKRPGLAPLAANPLTTTINTDSTSIPGALPMRQYSNSFSSRTASRSFGGPSSFGSSGEPESLGRKAARISFDMARQGATDKDEINDFLGLIDTTRSKSSLVGVGMNASLLIGSKTQAEEELKKFQKAFSIGDAFDSLGLGLRRKISKSSIQEEPSSYTQPFGSGESRPSSALFRRVGYTPPTPISPAPNSFQSSPVPNNLAFPQYRPKSRQTGFDLHNSSTNSINSIQSTTSEISGSGGVESRFEEEMVAGLELDLSEEDQIISISPPSVSIPLPNLFTALTPNALERGRSGGGSTSGARSRDATPSSTLNFREEEAQDFTRW